MAVDLLENTLPDDSNESGGTKISRSPAREIGHFAKCKPSSKNEASTGKTSKIPRIVTGARARAATADGVTKRESEAPAERPASAHGVQSFGLRGLRSHKELMEKQRDKITESKSQVTAKVQFLDREIRSQSLEKNKKPSTDESLASVTAENPPQQRVEQTVKRRTGIPSLKTSEIKKPLVKELVGKAKDKRKKTTRAAGSDRLDKVKTAMGRNFSNLVPLYETELKKIIDTWVNTIYCSLSMRRNLVKLLFAEFPDMDKSQFRMEDETLLESFFNAKSITKSEIRNFQEVINSLVESQTRLKKDYETKAAEYKEVAQSYNYNWDALQKKLKDLGIETRELQEQIPKLEEKRQEIEKVANEKIQKLEKTLSMKAEEINKLSIQMNMFKQRENNFKGNVLMKVEEYKDIKAEVDSLKTVEKEFEDMKIHYLEQKELFQKKIKDLELLLEEKKKTLEKESAIKKQLEEFLTDLQSHQKQLYRKAGKEQVEFVLGRNGKLSRREQLWMSAVRLVLKAFQAQVKRLERDRNKMLLELNSNDVENFTDLAASLLQKESFLNSIKHQMHAFHRISKCSRSQTPEEFQQTTVIVSEKDS